MISLDDKIAIYNSKVRRVASFKEVVEFLELGGLGEQGIAGPQGIRGEKGDTEHLDQEEYRVFKV